MRLFSYIQLPLKLTASSALLLRALHFYNFKAAWFDELKTIVLNDSKSRDQ